MSSKQGWHPNIVYSIEKWHQILDIWHINYVKQCTHRLLSTIGHLLEKCKEIFVFLHGHMGITKKIALLTLNT
jgi:hypothetical protein